MQLLWRATARKAARLGTRPARRQSCDLRQDLRSHDGKHVTSALLVDGVMLIVTREPIEAGQEVCIDYEDGGALGFAGVRLKHQHSCVLADEGSARARRRSELANRRRRCHRQPPSGWHLRRRFANFQRQRGPADPPISGFCADAPLVSKQVKCLKPGTALSIYSLYD